jgi:hypothetical protein
MCFPSPSFSFRFFPAVVQCGMPVRKRSQRPVIVLAAVAAIIAAALLGWSTDRAPGVPRDLFHAGVISEAGCLTCHTPGRQVPLKDSHPSRTDCLHCHEARTGR